MTEILQTERLALREIESSDALFVYELMTDPSWLEGIGDRGIRHIQDARDHIHNNLQKSYRDNGYGMYVVTLKTQPETALGLCGLINRPTLDDVDIGYALFPAYTGKGYAFEAAQAVLNFGKKQLQLEKIVAITSTTNESSGRLLERLGMQSRGLITLAGDNEQTRLFY